MHNINSLILIGPTAADEIVNLNQEIHSDCDKNNYLSKPTDGELQNINSTKTPTNCLRSLPEGDPHAQLKDSVHFYIYLTRYLHLLVS